MSSLGSKGSVCGYEKFTVGKAERLNSSIEFNKVRVE